MNGDIVTEKKFSLVLECRSGPGFCRAARCIFEEWRKLSICGEWACRRWAEWTSEGGSKWTGAFCCKRTCAGGSKWTDGRRTKREREGISKWSPYICQWLRRTAPSTSVLAQDRVLMRRTYFQKCVPGITTQNCWLFLQFDANMP